MSLREIKSHRHLFHLIHGYLNQISNENIAQTITLATYITLTCYS